MTSRPLSPRFENLCERGEWGGLLIENKKINTVFFHPWGHVNEERCGVESVRLCRSAPGCAGGKVRIASIRRSNFGADGKQIPLAPPFFISITRHVKNRISRMPLFTHLSSPIGYFRAADRRLRWQALGRASAEHGRDRRTLRCLPDGQIREFISALPPSPPLLYWEFRWGSELWMAFFNSSSVDAGNGDLDTTSRTSGNHEIQGFNGST